MTDAQLQSKALEAIDKLAAGDIAIPADDTMRDACKILCERKLLRLCVMLMKQDGKSRIRVGYELTAAGRAAMKGLQ